MPQTVEDYKNYVEGRLQLVTGVLPNIATGDFSKRLDIPPEEDEFTELYAGINYMLEDIEENLRKRKEVEGQLRESEQKYRDIVELAPDGIITIDMDETITSCNESFTDITGFSKDEIIGKHFSKIPTLQARDVPTWIKMFASIIKGKTPPPLEFEWAHKDGILNWGEVRISILKRGNNITGVQVIIRDITEEKRAKEREKQHMLDIQYLSDTALGFVRLASEADIYKYIAEHVLKLTKDSIVIVNSFDPITDLTTVEEILGLGKLIKSALKILGQDPIGTNYKINEKARRQLLTGKYHKVPGKLRELTFGEMPIPICKALEKLFKIREIHSMGITYEGNLLGDVVIILRNETELENIQVIETIINQAAVAMQRQKMENEFNKSQDNYRKIFENVHDMVIYVNKQGRIIDVNDRIEDIFGYTRKEVVGKNFMRLGAISLKDLPRVIKMFKHAAKVERVEDPTGDGINYNEFEIKRKNGERAFIETSTRILKKDGKTEGFLSIIRDITERKKAEEKISYRMEFEQTISNISSRFVSGQDFDDNINSSLAELGRMSNASRAYLYTFCRTNSIMVNTHEWCTGGVSTQIDNLKEIPTDSFPWWMGKLYNREVIQIEDVSQMPREASAEKEILESQDIKSLLVLPVYSKGELAGFIGIDNVTETAIWSDIDLKLLRTASEIIGNAIERKEAEEVLRESEEKYSSVVENSKDGIVIHQDGIIKFVNSATTELTGISRDQLLERNISEFITPDYRELFLQRYADRLSGKDVPNIYEISVMIKDNSVFPAEINCTIINYQGKPSALLFLRDITERKKMTEELLQSEKLASIGRLAAGMAHEVNTPLTNISLITENMMKMTNDPELQKKMRSLSEQRRIASNIVASLLSFSRKIEPKMTTLKLDAVLSESISSLENTKPDNIEIELDIQKELPEIKADHGQLRQAFTNIINNALDAMPEGGKLSIKALKKDSENIEITFIDTGLGISAEDLEHVFEPFFTKKEVGKGVGLGLSISHGIIQAHNGTIRVESEEGRGTAFTITLPEG